MRLCVILACALIALTGHVLATDVMIVNWRVHNLDFGGFERAKLVKGAQIYQLNLSGRARADVADGSEIDYVYLTDESRLRILGGDVGMLDIGGTADIEIRRATFKELPLPVEADSGPDIFFVGAGLAISPRAKLHLYASDTRFENGQLSGTFDNGEKFTVWILTRLNAGGEPRYQVSTSLPTNLAVHDLVGPSFECARATKSVEKTICEQSDIAKLDRRLSLLFGRLTRDAKLEKAVVASQREWLSAKRDLCIDRDCIERAYQSRIAELERVSGDFSRTFVETLCNRIADPAGRRRMLQHHSGIDDVNNDGHPETTKICDGGTMHAPCREYYGRSGQRLSIRTIGFEWKTFLSFGVQPFRFENLTFFLNSYDDLLARPAYVSYVTPANNEYLLCEFGNRISSKIQRAEPGTLAICEAAIGLRDSVADLSPPNDDITWDEQHPGGRIGSGRTILVDVDNDGVNEQIVPKYFESGAGRGCATNFYDILNTDGSGSIRHSSTTGLAAMQGLDLGYGPIGCGTVRNRLFRYSGKTFYEQNIESSDSASHTVSMLTQGGRSGDLRVRQAHHDDHAVHKAASAPRVAPVNRPP